MQKNTLPVILSFGLPILLFGISWIALGFYWGWLDDVIMEQNYRGFLSGGTPIANTLFYHSGLSHVYVQLYRFFPSVPWYGIMLTFYNLLATLCFFRFIYHIAEGLKLKPWAITGLLTALFFLLWVENVFLITFTRTAILMMGSALLCLIQHRIRHPDRSAFSWNTAFLLSIFTIGYLTRYETSVFPLAFVLTLTILWPGSSFSSWRKKWLPLFLSVFAIVAVHFVVNQAFQSDDTRSFKKQWPFIWSTLDGFNFSEENPDRLMHDPADSIRLFAARTWFFMDDEKMGTAFFERIGTRSPFTLKTLRSWKQNLAEEVEKACCDYKEYHKPLNWWGKSVGYAIFSLGISLAFLLLFLFGKTTYKPLLRTVLYQLAFWLAIIGTTIFLKMEDRILTPVFIVHLGGSILLTTQLIPQGMMSRNRTKRFQAAFILFLLAGAMTRMPGYFRVAAENRAELKMKTSVIQNLNSNSAGRILIVDNYSRLLLHGTPFQVIQIDPSISITAWGEPATNVFHQHREYLRTLCGSDTFIGFYDCLYQKRGNVRFLLADFRMSMLEAYMEILYARDYHFVEEEVLPIPYSFLWFPVKYGYYRFADPPEK